MRQESRPITQTERAQKFRQRFRAAGETEVLIKLPVDMVAFLDDLKARHGLRSRSEVLIQFIDQRRATAQQTT
jgi:metal-responsive CopG/Arc/MetJ family transcriptional regulator